MRSFTRSKGKNVKRWTGRAYEGLEARAFTHLVLGTPAAHWTN